MLDYGGAITPGDLPLMGDVVRIDEPAAGRRPP
jgi:hypothetical protein